MVVMVVVDVGSWRDRVMKSLLMEVLSVGQSGLLRSRSWLTAPPALSYAETHGNLKNTLDNYRLWTASSMITLTTKPGYESGRRKYFNFTKLHPGKKTPKSTRVSTHCPQAGHASAQRVPPGNLREHAALMICHDVLEKAAEPNRSTTAYRRRNYCGLDNDRSHRSHCRLQRELADHQAWA